LESSGKEFDAMENEAVDCGKAASPSANATNARKVSLSNPLHRANGGWQAVFAAVGVHHEEHRGHEGKKRLHCLVPAFVNFV